jgi:hypothetical protein
MCQSACGHRTFLNRFSLAIRYVTRGPTIVLLLREHTTRPLSMTFSSGHNMKIMFLLGLCVGVASADTFDIRGEITLLSSLADTNAPPKVRSKEFRALVSDTNWWIRTEVTNPPAAISADAAKSHHATVVDKLATVYVGPEGIRQAAEYGFSGGAAAYKQIPFQLGTNSVKSQPGAMSRLGRTPEQIDLFEGISIPPWDSSLCFPVWLAYCSRSRFPEGETSAPPVLWLGMPEQSENVYTVLAKRRRSSRDYFANEIEFRNRGYFPRYQPKMTFTPKRYSDGTGPFIEARYYTSNWSTFGTIEFPSISYLDFYSAPPSKLIKRFIVSVRSFTSSLEVVPDVTPTGIAVIRDHRAPATRAAPLRYLTRDKILEPTSSPVRRLLEAAQRSSTEAQAKARARSVSRLLILVFLVTMSCAPLVLGARKLWNGHKTKGINTDHERNKYKCKDIFK